MIISGRIPKMTPVSVADFFLVSSPLARLLHGTRRDLPAYPKKEKRDRLVTGIFARNTAVPFACTVMFRPLLIKPS